MQVAGRSAASDKHVAWLLTGALGCVGFWLNGLGAVMPMLQRELHTTRAVVAFYPSMFALGLVTIGLLAPGLAGSGRRHAAFMAAIVALAAGAGLLSAAVAPALSLLGALAMGVGAAMIVALVPALGTDVHGRGAAGVLSRANALASAAGVLAPLLVAAAVAIGVGWQAGYVIVPVVAALALLVWMRRHRVPDAAVRPPDRPAASVASFNRLWINLVLAVSVEFCMVFWATSYLRDNLSLRTATAAALAGAFLAGMALGRACHAPVTRLARTADRAVILVVLVAVAGFATFWLAQVAWLAAVGLAITGTGVALLYPLTVARYVGSAAAGSAHASARAALGSGIAIGIAPFALAVIAGAIGLHLAYLLVPILCLLLIANTGGRRETRSLA